MTLEIADDGVGFDTGTSRPVYLDLQTMAERAANVDGDIEVISVPGQGTTVRVTAPIVVGG